MFILKYLTFFSFHPDLLDLHTQLSSEYAHDEKMSCAHHRLVSGGGAFRALKSAALIADFCDIIPAYVMCHVVCMSMYPFQMVIGIKCLSQTYVEELESKWKSPLTPL